MHRCFDSHCHVRLQIGADAACSLVPATSPRDVSGDERHTVQWVGGLFCGTHPDVDWHVIDAIAANGVAVAAGAGQSAVVGDEMFHAMVGYGVHPWYVPTSSSPAPREPEEEGSGASSCCAGKGESTPSSSWTVPGLMELLEHKLLACPHAWVGEIGLDKMRPSVVDPNAAILLFTEQLRLAAKHRRPVSVHCVRSFGPLLTILTKLPIEHFPPAVILHGFTGSVDFATSLLKLPKKKSTRIFFGIGQKTTATLSSFGALLEGLPVDRLLFESDAHWILSPASHSPSSSSDNKTMCVRLCADDRLSTADRSFLARLPPAALRENFERLVGSLS